MFSAKYEGKKKEEKISFLTNGTYLECLQSLKNDIKQALYLLFKLISNCKYIFLCFDKESQEIFSLFYIIPSKSYICKVQEKFNKINYDVIMVWASKRLKFSP